MSKETTTNELAEIICKAIQDEPYFSKEVLIPKIKALIIGFRLRISSKNYEKTLSDKAKENLIRSNEIQNFEKKFWQNKLKEKIGVENMKQYFIELDKELEKWKVQL